MGLVVIQGSGLGIFEYDDDYVSGRQEGDPMAFADVSKTKPYQT